MRHMICVGIMFVVLGVAIWCNAASDEDRDVRYNPDHDGLVIHEWGVIRDILKGEEKLPPSGVPDFVVNSSVEVYPPDADKPVIYIYNGREAKLDLAVGIPSYGTILHWPPAEVGEYVRRTLEEDGVKRVADKDAGMPDAPSYGAAAEVFWRNVCVQENRTAKTARTVEEAHWWNQSRKVDSNVLTAGGEEEKFLFYEAPGMYYIPAARPKRMKGENAALSLREGSLLAGAENPTFASLFAVNIARGEGRAVFKSSLAMEPGTQTIDLDSVEAKKTDGDDWKSATVGKLQHELETAGLYTDEARQVAKIWNEEFFQREGRRIIYFLPREEYDAMFPLYVSVRPDKIVRVMMVVIEY